MKLFDELSKPEKIKLLCYLLNEYDSMRDPVSNKNINNFFHRDEVNEICIEVKKSVELNKHIEYLTELEMPGSFFEVESYSKISNELKEISECIINGTYEREALKRKRSLKLKTIIL